MEWRWSRQKTIKIDRSNPPPPQSNPIHSLAKHWYGPPGSAVKDAVEGDPIGTEIE